MKKIIIVTLIIMLAFATIAFYVRPMLNYQITGASSNSIFSEHANRIFMNSVATGIDLNSGITMERALPVNPNQINNITFAVFNHTDEPIEFSDRGFSLTVFGYNETTNQWEKLKLPHLPYPESVTLPPKTENWDSDINSWDILENDSTALGYKKLRLYIFGKGKFTSTLYGAYLDIMLNE